MARGDDPPLAILGAAENIRDGITVEVRKAELIERNREATLECDPRTRSSARQLQAIAVPGDDIAPGIPVEITEAHFVQLLRRRFEECPVHPGSARNPPRDSCWQKEIVPAVAVEIADAISAVRIEANDISRPDLDMLTVPRQVDGVLALVVLEPFVGKDVEADRRQLPRSAPNLDGVVVDVLKGVVGEPEFFAGIAAEIVAPRAAVAVDVELMRVFIPDRAVNAPSLQHKVLVRTI